MAKSTGTALTTGTISTDTGTVVATPDVSFAPSPMGTAVAAALGFPTAVGHCCCLGWGGRAQDFDKAFELFSAAAEKGYPRAEVRVGYCYFYGHGVDVDPSWV